MSLYLSIGAPDLTLDSAKLNELLTETLDKIGPRRNVLALPPDLTRAHSPRRRADALCVAVLRRQA